MTGVIGTHVLELLRERVTSYDVLEILMFLHAHRDEAWNKARLGERIYVPLDHIAEALEMLTRHDLLVREAGTNSPLYRYGASDPLNDAVEELARLFVEQRALIMSVMSANSIERVRSKVATAFANAFILSKKPEDG